MKNIVPFLAASVISFSCPSVACAGKSSEVSKVIKAISVVLKDNNVSGQSKDQKAFNIDPKSLADQKECCGPIYPNSFTGGSGSDPWSSEKGSNKIFKTEQDLQYYYQYNNAPKEKK
jgi:hypothetical protein